ncbi:MAG: trehalose-phosphatase [Bacteroidales bacterium]|nr:trehalose-phosphatase [Bacteroidales bacterium]
MEEHKTGGQTRIDALIFDLDGVVTQTRKLHKKAWKQLFDEFFLQASKRNSGVQLSDDNPSGMSDNDYAVYIDGKPRYEGVKSFLKSRNIGLSSGDAGDPPDALTICGLGNRKNELFRQLLTDEGAEVYQDTVDKIHHWRQHGLKTAIVSSSKNCKTILEQAGIEGLFDVRVDGVISEELGLKGKPHPDIFLKAAEKLNARHERCIVFEDAASGVQAGQAGCFGLVVGVSRFDNARELFNNGADVCIDDFLEFEIIDNDDVEKFFKASAPMVFSKETAFFQRFNKKKPAFFLDYDGTLTPIVQRPEDAVLSDEMRETLSKLAEKFSVAVVTGRDIEDVQQFIRLDNIIYSGSHGYVTSGPDGMYMEHEDAEKITTAMDVIEEELHGAFKNKARGVQVDRKRFAVAVHYRNADKKDISFVFDVVDRMLKKHKGHKKGEGKMVVEIKPDIDWHKGKAVLWIMEALGLDNDRDILPVFIGDDITDEDAFMAIKDKGVGVLVENHGQETAAAYSLKNVYQVRKLFERMLEMY